MAPIILTGMQPATGERAMAITQIHTHRRNRTDHGATARATRSTPAPLGVWTEGRRQRSGADGEQQKRLLADSEPSPPLGYGPQRWRTAACQRQRSQRGSQRRRSCLACRQHTPMAYSQAQPPKPCSLSLSQLTAYRARRGPSTGASRAQARAVERGGPA